MPKGYKIVGMIVLLWSIYSCSVKIKNKKLGHFKLGIDTVKYNFSNTLFDI